MYSHNTHRDTHSFSIHTSCQYIYPVNTYIITYYKLSSLANHTFTLTLSSHHIAGSDVPGASAQSISAPIAMELKQTINLR